MREIIRFETPNVGDQIIDPVAHSFHMEGNYTTAKGKSGTMHGLATSLPLAIDFAEDFLWTYRAFRTRSSRVTNTRTGEVVWSSDISAAFLKTVNEQKAANK